MPGEFFVTARDMLIVSVVGASVVLCARDTHNGIGGMTHFMAPSQHHELQSHLRDVAQVVALNAISLLVKKLLLAGAKMDRLEVKVFSGPRAYNELLHADVAFLETKFKAVKLVPKIHLLKVAPVNKVYFFPKTGKVLVKKLSAMKNSTVADRQQCYIDSVIAGAYRQPAV